MPLDSALELEKAHDKMLAAKTMVEQREAAKLYVEAERTHLSKLGVLNDGAAQGLVGDLKVYRRLTVLYSVIASGIVCLLLAYFISTELANGLEDQQHDLSTQQDRLLQEQVDSCLRGGIARNSRFSYAVDEEATAVYMAGQENDPEIRQGWVNKSKYEAQRQVDIMDEADRIGFRLPGTVFNDCDKVVSAP